MDKRTFLKTALLTGTGSLLAFHKRWPSNPAFATESIATKTENLFPQPPLGYAYNALEPYIDALTMELHYSKHHASYTKNFNTAIREEHINETDILKIFGSVSKYSTAIRNNGGGYYNHNLLWETMQPGNSKIPNGPFANAVVKTFGSFDRLKEEFFKKAMSVFGSGWAWLVNNNGSLQLTATANQDNPLMDVVPDKGFPLLLIDVWEHAYYLKYQNKRQEYVEAFWNLINWKKVSERFLYV